MRVRIDVAAVVFGLSVISCASLPVAEPGAAEPRAARSPTLGDAVFAGSLDEVRWHLDHGASADEPIGFTMFGTPVRHTPLFVAVARSDHRIARLLLERGADPDAFQSIHTSCLKVAAWKNDLRMVRLLMAFRTSPSAGVGTGLTALDIADAKGFRRLARYLEREGWHRNRSGEPLLPGLTGLGLYETGWPASAGNLPFTQLVLDLGARTVYEGTNDPDYPLKVAMQAGNPDVVKLLLDGGADIRPPWNQSSYFVNLFGLASRNRPQSATDSLAIGEALLAHGAPVSATALSSPNILSLLIQEGSYVEFAVPFLRLLMENGADVNQVMPDGGSLLWMALQERRPEIIACLAGDGALLIQGASAKSVRVSDHSRLWREALDRHDAAALETLLLAPPDQGSPYPRDGVFEVLSPESYCVITGRDRLLELLLDHRGNPNVRDWHTGWSLLHYAAAFGERDTVRWLLDRGASPLARVHFTDREARERGREPGEGYLPEEIAALAGNRRMERLLRRWRQMSEAVEPRPYGLIAAASANDVDTVRHLLRLGSDDQRKEIPRALTASLRNSAAGTASVLLNHVSASARLDTRDWVSAAVEANNEALLMRLLGHFDFRDAFSFQLSVKQGMDRAIRLRKSAAYRILFAYWVEFCEPWEREVALYTARAEHYLLLSDLPHRTWWTTRKGSAVPLTNRELEKALARTKRPGRD